MLITSPKNPRVRAAMRLRERAARDEQRRFLVDGRREVALAHSAGFSVQEVFFQPSAASANEGLTALVQRLADSGALVYEVSSAVFERIAFGSRDEGIVAVAEQRSLTLEQLALPAQPLVLVLDGVEKPGNIGAVLRTADAAGAHALLLTAARTDIFNPNAIRASLGAVFTMPVVATNAASVQRWCRDRSITMFAARVDAQQSYFEQSFRQPAAIVLGSEAHGLGAEWTADDILPVYLPMQGRVDSLNVSVAAAILLYEAVRQRWNPRPTNAH